MRVKNKRHGLKEKISCAKALVKNDGESGISGLPKVTLQKQTAGRGGKDRDCRDNTGKSRCRQGEACQGDEKAALSGSLWKVATRSFREIYAIVAAEWLLKKGVKEVVSGF